jgi:biopolymer transport protein ExbB/TolQ
MDQVREKLQQKDFDGVAEICDSPQYWSKTTAQLILVALANRERGPVKLRQLLAEKFERDVLAELRHRHSWVATVTRAAPLLGLLGTVTSMVMAFAELGAQSREGMDPALLAGKLSLALQATMLGLWIAVPMTLLGSAILVRIGKLTDSVQEQVGEFLYDLEVVMREPRAWLRVAHGPPVVDARPQVRFRCRCSANPDKSDSTPTSMTSRISRR